MPLVSWGFLGVWAGGRASPAQTLIGPDRGWREADLNRRHLDFQSSALPAELSRRDPRSYRFARSSGRAPEPPAARRSGSSAALIGGVGRRRGPLSPVALRALGRGRTFRPSVRRPASVRRGAATSAEGGVGVTERASAVRVMLPKPLISANGNEAGFNPSRIYWPSAPANRRSYKPRRKIFARLGWSASSGRMARWASASHGRTSPRSKPLRNRGHR
jgi:hypothetical protein